MPGWEYLFVAAYPSQGTHRANRVNGQALEGWENGPTIYEYTQHLGEDGWEMVSANTLPFMTAELSYHFVFKRPTTADAPVRRIAPPNGCGDALNPRSACEQEAITDGDPPSTP